LNTTSIFKTSDMDFHVRVWGESGKKVLMLHGFPETPEIFEPLAKLLVEQGFHVHAPFLPGYGPAAAIHTHTEVTHLDDLAKCLSDLACVIKQPSEKILLVGHDWGAIAAYVTAAYAPALFSHLVTMAVPPLPSVLRGLLRHPMQWYRSSYILFFQLRWRIPERLLRRNNDSLLRRMCMSWSGKAEQSRAYFSTTDSPFEAIGDLAYPLGYYRGLFPLLSGSIKKWRRSIRLAYSEIPLKTTIFVGDQDGCIPAPLYCHYERYFPNGAEVVVVPGAGHFVPIDAPDRIANVLVSARDAAENEND
jgi:pimeloyl-ACP methyl ester carboxylesterase